MGSLGLCQLVHCGGIHLVQLVYLLYQLLTSTDGTVGDQVLLCSGQCLSLCGCLSLGRLESEAIYLMHNSLVIVIILIASG